MIRFLLMLAILATGLLGDPAEDAKRVAVERQRQCLALAGFAEARSDGDAAMATVMRVVLNRATDKARRWPRDFCGVVMQPSQFLGVESLRTHAPSIAELPAWRRALDLADATVARAATVPSECLQATNFHQSRRVAGLNQVCRVGVHTFFTEPRTIASN